MDNEDQLVLNMIMHIMDLAIKCGFSITRKNPQDLLIPIGNNKADGDYLVINFKTLRWRIASSKGEYSIFHNYVPGDYEKLLQLIANSFFFNKTQMDVNKIILIHKATRKAILMSPIASFDLNH